MSLALASSLVSSTPPLFHRQEGTSEGTTSNRTKRDYAKVVPEKVIPFYLKRNIPMVVAKSGSEKIIEIFEKNAKLRKILVDRRRSPNVLGKPNDIVTKLQKTFPMSARNAEQAIKNSEDLKFLYSMKTYRIPSFGVFDQALSSQVKRMQARFLKEKKSEENAKQEVRGKTVQLADSYSSQEEDKGSEHFISPTQKKTPHRTVHPGTTAFTPYDILKSPKLVSLATRI